MSESGGADVGSVPQGVPEAVTRHENSLSLVWLVPLLALVIGGWIGWRALSERGPTVTIEFKSAAGLESGKTKVAYKDLQVGRVTSINLSEDISHVLVTAELSRGAENYMTENTRFWVVRPQVSAGRISGLGTILSGAYIAIDPVLDGEFQEHFVGLETPPVVTTSEEGAVFTLQSKELGSVDVGAPVYYHQIQVGEVAAFEMDPSGEYITTQVFIRAPHDDRVRANTRFWNASGINLTVDAEGLRVETSSLVSMLIGGLAFDNHDPNDLGEHVAADTVFTLFSDRRASEQPFYSVTQRFLLHFDNSVQGLAPGSPVMFRGIRVGKVLDVTLELDPHSYDVRVPVAISIQPERISLEGAEEGLGRVERLVANGMRAQLGRGNLITGALQVDLDIHTSAAEARILVGGRYPELPTIPTPFAEITASVSGVVAKIDRMPLEQIGRDLQGSLSELRKMLTQVNQLASGFQNDTLPSLNSTLASVDLTVSNLDSLLAEDAPLPIELRKALEDVGEAARSVRVLADYLEQHPESLIRGK
jgi:paraquat-inducible protein B